MQFEAAESRTAVKDVHQRGETFILCKHRKIQPRFVALHQELSSRVLSSGWWVLQVLPKGFCLLRVCREPPLLGHTSATSGGNAGGRGGAVGGFGLEQWVLLQRMVKERAHLSPEAIRQFCREMQKLPFLKEGNLHWLCDTLWFVPPNLFYEQPEYQQNQ